MDLLGDYDDVEEASEVVIDPFAHVADSDSDSDSDAGETSKTARKLETNVTPQPAKKMKVAKEAAAVLPTASDVLGSLDRPTFLDGLRADKPPDVLDYTNADPDPQKRNPASWASVRLADLKAEVQQAKDEGWEGPVNANLDLKPFIGSVEEQRKSKFTASRKCENPSAGKKCRCVFCLPNLTQAQRRADGGPTHYDRNELEGKINETKMQEWREKQAAKREAEGKVYERQSQRAEKKWS